MSQSSEPNTDQPSDSSPSFESTSVSKTSVSLRSSRRLLRMCKKEMLETLRDRRTMITLVMMPLLLYPLLGMAFNRFLYNYAAGASEETAYRIGVDTEAEGETLLRWLEDPRSQPPEEILNASDGKLAKFKVLFSGEAGIDTLQSLKNNEIDLAAKVTAGQPPLLELTSYEGDAGSAGARRILVERLEWLRLALAEEVAKQAQEQYQPPAQVTLASIGEPAAPSALGTVIPLVLVLMTITGAVYPAIDLTAGERERGTMEALMASPVPRSYILLSKYVAVVTVALLTALANLVAMFMTLWASQLLPLVTGQEDGLPWLAMVQILGLLVLFSGFFAAVLLSLTSYARSFKEAQAYLIPIMLLSLTPGVLSLMPGVTLSGPMAIAPLVNIVLLAREVLQGTAQAGPAMLTVISTVGYAFAAISIAAKLFGGDAVSRTSGASIAGLFTRPANMKLVPTTQAAAMTLALLVPLYYLSSNFLVQFGTTLELSLANKLLLSALALILAFGLFPWLVARFNRCQLSTTYQLKSPSALSIVGAVLVGIGAWGVMQELFLLADAMGIRGLDDEKIAQAKETARQLQDVPLVILLFAMALTPAVVEEFCFRGFLFTALKRLMTPWRLIFVTALVFGLFHVVTGNMLLPERFLPTTAMGVILGWIAWKTQSIWPGIVAHFSYNGLLMTIGKYRDQLDWLGSTDGESKHLPMSWLIPLVIVTIVGLLIVHVASVVKSDAVTQEVHPGA